MDFCRETTVEIRSACCPVEDVAWNWRSGYDQRHTRLVQYVSGRIAIALEWKTDETPDPDRRREVDS
jgi:hypothetical protein